MIKLIVGLGNPGQQYEKTRHNAGFLFLDRLVLGFGAGAGWTKQPKFDGMIDEIEVAGSKLMLLKPCTFMNRSGQAVGKIARYYKLAPEEILVVHDELDFAPGAIKLKKDGGHAGHNGLRDIIAHLGSKSFYRLRVGVGRPAVGKEVAAFVLSSPSRNEMNLMLAAIDFASDQIDQVITCDMMTVMNKINSR